MNIFLLEDDSRVAESMIRALEIKGHDVVHVKSIQEGAWNLGLMWGHLDLAILDFNVGMEKGTDLLPLIDFPVVGYSGLPGDMVKEAPNLKVFSKGDPFSLLDYVESMAQEASERPQETTP